MDRRMFLMVLSGSLLAAPLAAKAQQAGKVARIGFLEGRGAGPHLPEAFRQGLRDLGYVEGRNVVIETRDAEGNFERLHALAAELVALKVDVIVAGGIWQPGGSGERTEKDMLKGAEVAARALGVRPQFVEVRGPEDFDRTFSEMTRARAGAVTVLPTTMFIIERRRLVDVTAKNRLPTVYQAREFVDGGGLMAYGPNLADLVHWVIPG